MPLRIPYFIMWLLVFSVSYYHFAVYPAFATHDLYVQITVHSLSNSHLPPRDSAWSVDNKLAMGKGIKLITWVTVAWIHIFQNRRLYSSTARQQLESSARTSHKLFYKESIELLLPGPVKYIERSTPMITKSELDEYFYPLFCRGWGIQRLETSDNSVSSIWFNNQVESPLNSYVVSRAIRPLFWYINSASKGTGLPVHFCKRSSESKVKKR